MHIIRGLGNLPPRFRGSAITIGNFDGVHRGHQAVFQSLCHRARELESHALAMTFEPHPVRLLHPERAPPRITGVRAKARWMEAYGVDAMLILRFTRPLAALQADDFVRQVLVDKLAVRDVLVGYDFRFGAGGQGNFATLTAMGAEYGFTVCRQEPFYQEGGVVSSTRVRQAVFERDFSLAAQLLGRPFEIEGRVCRGFQRGKTLGFPTANLALTDLLHPPMGVYLVEGRINGHWLPGVANVGHNPTFGGRDEPLLEVHLLAAMDDFYGRVIRVRFHKPLREQRRFSGVPALVEQIREDVRVASDYFNVM